MVGYTAQADPDTTSKAIAKELPISPKFSREICRMVRGRKVEDAIRMLEEVVELRRPVPIRRYNMGVAHKKGVGPGRFPKKAASAIIKVLQSAKSNAEYKGLDAENMRVRTISAHLGRTTPGYMPRAHGRSTAWDQQTVNIEVILEEAQ
ncbi:MAG: 50S ribosomal protein L22 [Methanomassiliicoccales archaeon]|nr:50S ribosomal protein L22 [Methanomassiliicoccales archaeon]